MLSGLVVMIDSDEDGQFDDTENLEDHGFKARKMQEDRFVTGSDATGSIQSGNAADNHLTGHNAQIVLHRAALDHTCSGNQHRTSP